MRPRSLSPLLLVASGALSAAVAHAAPPPRVASIQHAGPPSTRGGPHGGRSVGSPTEGRLVGGAHLEEGPCLKICPAYAGGDVRWGLDALVGMIDRASRQVRRQYPGSVLNVGHLSRAGGGDVDRHVSHESGRDADVGFFIKAYDGRALVPDHFVAFRGDGTAASWPGAYFDDARNWLLVTAFVTDPRARVTHIFVAAPLRARLLAYGERIGTPYAIRVRAAEVMAQPRGALPHDDHFHVRIGCPDGMAGCVEQPTARAHGGHGADRVRGRSTAIAAHRPPIHPDHGAAPVAASPGRPSLPSPKAPLPHGAVPPPAEPSDARPTASPPVSPAAPPAALPTEADGVDDVDGVTGAVPGEGTEGAREP